MATAVVAGAAAVVAAAHPDWGRIVAERADHLARLVEDLLPASRIPSEPEGTAVVGMQRECIDLAEAARRAAADWLGGSGSRLELELPPGRLRSTPTPAAGPGAGQPRLQRPQVLPRWPGLLCRCS